MYEKSEQQPTKLPCFLKQRPRYIGKKKPDVVQAAEHLLSFRLFYKKILEYLRDFYSSYNIPLGSHVVLCACRQ